MPLLIIFLFVVFFLKEQENGILEKELNSCRNELKISISRIENFQSALNNMNESSELEFDRFEKKIFLYFFLLM